MSRPKEKAIAGGSGDRSRPRKPRAKSEGARHKKVDVVTEVLDAEAEISATASEQALVLPDSLDSSSAASIRDLLLARRGSSLVVDAGQVQRVGIQSLQVLLAAAHMWRAEGQSYTVRNPSAALLETIALVGLSADQLHFEGSSP